MICLKALESEFEKNENIFGISIAWGIYGILLSPLAYLPLRGREDFFEKNLFGSPSDPESKNIVFIDTVQF